MENLFPNCLVVRACQDPSFLSPTVYPVLFGVYVLPGAAPSTEGRGRSSPRRTASDALLGILFSFFYM